MKTIAIREETHECFVSELLKYQARINQKVNHDQFLMYLLEEEKKR